MMCIRIAKRIMKIQIKKLLLKAKEIMSIVALMKMVGTSEENGGSTNQDECSSDVNEDPDCLAAVTPEAIKPGAFILVNFESQKKKVYTYVATCQTLLCQNEVQVMCLNKCGQSLSLFKLNEKDISYVQYTQIVGTLPYLNITQRGIYKFLIPLKMVYERV